jgi:hypothetical protein
MKSIAKEGEKKAAASGGGFLGGWLFKPKEPSKPTVKAKLGQKNAFYFDEKVSLSLFLLPYSRAC